MSGSIIQVPHTKAPKLLDLVQPTNVNLTPLQMIPERDARAQLTILTVSNSPATRRAPCVSDFPPIQANRLTVWHRPVQRVAGAPQPLAGHAGKRFMALQ
jgi:hypothetical protein